MNPSRQTGFTLVELILVIVVMGVLAGVAIPRLTSRQSLDEVSAQDELKAMLRHARKVATTQQRDVCVRRAGTQVLAMYVPGPPFVAGCNVAWQAVPDPATGQNLQIDLPPNVAVGGTAFVRFNGVGQLVPNNADLAMTVGTTLSVTVSRETGFVF